MVKKKPAKDIIDWLAIREAPNWSVARPLGAAVSMLLLAAFVLALLAGGSLLVFTIGNGEASLGAGALIVAVLSAPFLVWNTWIRHRALGFQKEGHLTDRLAKAVEQLGAEKVVKRIVTGADGEPKTQETSEPNLEVRIGGLLSLERIAQDSTAYDKGRDHVRVMEIICAYIRNNAPASEAKDFPLAEWEPLAGLGRDAERAAQVAYHRLRFCDRQINQQVEQGNLREWLRTVPAPREDIAIALRILGRRSQSQRRIEAARGLDGQTDADWIFAEVPPAPELGHAQRVTDVHALLKIRADLDAHRNRLFEYRGYRFDLRNTCLQNASMEGFDLAGARLDGARLEGANLRQAHLTGAVLNYAKMDGAILDDAALDCASLVGARLDGASLVACQLEGSVLVRASLNGADLTRVRMAGVDGEDARLEGVVLHQARLEAAIMRSTRLDGAHLNEAGLEAANFMFARFDYASLRSARLNWALFVDNEMFGADFRGAKTVELYNTNGATLLRAAFRNSDLSNIQTTQEQIDQSVGDATVILPTNITMPKSWESNLGAAYDAYDSWRRANCYSRVDERPYERGNLPTLATPP